MEVDQVDIQKLYDEIIRLKKIKNSLIKRVESMTSQSNSAFSLFEKNCLLQDEVDKRKLEIDKIKNELVRKNNALDETSLISETDQHGRIIYVNKKFCEVSGFSKDELIGNSHSIIKSEFHPPEFWENFWNTIKSKQIFRGEICNKKKSGEWYWVSTTVLPNLDGDGNIIGFSSVRFDITEKKMSENQLIHNEKLAALGELAASIGHEINNPLAICFGNVHFLKKNLSKDESIDREKLLEKIEKLNNALIRVKFISDGLKNYSRVDGDENSLLSVNDAINQTLNFVREIYTKQNINIDINLPKENYIAYANMGKLQQIIMNLISNARDATEKVKNRTIQVILKKYDDKNLVISVTDNGSGIPKQILDKITKLYFTTKENGKGTGIGLGLVVKFIASFKGQLKIESEVGQGSTFHVILPLHEIQYE